MPLLTKDCSTPKNHPALDGYDQSRGQRTRNTDQHEIAGGFGCRQQAGISMVWLPFYDPGNAGSTLAALTIARQVVASIYQHLQNGLVSWHVEPSFITLYTHLQGLAGQLLVKIRHLIVLLPGVGRGRLGFLQKCKADHQGNQHNSDHLGHYFRRDAHRAPDHGDTTRYCTKFCARIETGHGETGAKGKGKASRNVEPNGDPVPLQDYAIVQDDDKRKDHAYQPYSK